MSLSRAFPCLARHFKRASRQTSPRWHPIFSGSLTPSRRFRKKKQKNKAPRLAGHRATSPPPELRSSADRIDRSHRSAPIRSDRRARGGEEGVGGGAAGDQRPGARRAPPGDVAKFPRGSRAVGILFWSWDLLGGGEGGKGGRGENEDRSFLGLGLKGA